MKNFKLSFMPFLICPIYSLIWGIHKLLSGNKSAIIAISLAFGLFAFLTPPVTDLYRHTLDYYLYKGMSFSNFVNGYRSFDFIIPFCEWSLANLNIPYNYLRFFLFFLTTYLQLNLFYKITTNSFYSFKELSLRLFAVLLLCFSLSTIIGVRWGVAVTLYVYGAFYLIHECKKKTAFFYFFIAAMVHFSMLPFVLFIYIASYVHIPKYLFPFCIIVAFVLSLTVGAYVESFLLSRDLYGSDYVSSGETGSGSAFISFNGLVFKYTSRLTKLPYVLVFWLFYDNRTLWTRWIGSALLLFALFYKFDIITSRTISFFSGISLFYLLCLEITNQRTIKYFRLILVCLAIMTSFTIYQYRKMFSVAHYEYMFIPAPFSLTQDYDMNWITTNLDENGEVK